tara:strand:+ start:179 stop:592 length:414 start_codon:yes stop_codon:yes gene_type:complete
MKNVINSRATLGIGALCLYFGIFPPISSRNNLANDEINTIIKKTNDAFDLAETKVFPDKPDDKPVGPHPDVEKCVCKGTGKITHGDGHQTDCPYHGGDDTEKTSCKCDTKSTYCNCVEAYGECSCKKKKRIFNLGRR